MKRITYVWLATMVVASLGLHSAAQDQSLGSYARAVRKDKPAQQAAKKYDNDNLPKIDTLSVVGNAPAEAADKTAPAGASPNGEPMATPDSKPADKTGSSAADQQKMVDDWKKKITDEKNQIDLMSRELDVAQREYRLRSAAFYADAGNRLRNEASWDKQDADYKEQIAQKQKALDAARQQLSDLQEQARKAGVPSRARE
jgi:hypothetical protein